MFEGTMGEIHEKCAVVGVFDPNAAELTALALRELDHRGPDSTGIGGLTVHGDFETFRAPGRARNVLSPDRIGNLGKLGLVATVGHGRYATSSEVYHPIQANDTLYAENGNGSDLSLLEADLGQRSIDTSAMNDSEMSAWAIGDRVKRGASVVEAIADAYPLMIGAHASVVIGKGLDGEPTMHAWRDECGIRPLVLGSTPNGGYMVASETTGLEAAGSTYIREVEPGELITVNGAGIESYQLATPRPKFDPFEIIYFSNKNSLFKNHRIGDIRAALGQMLAAEYGHTSHGTATVSIPHSANTYAEGYAEALDIDYLRNAITKKSTDRTFLQPTAADRAHLRDKTYGFDWRRLNNQHLDVIDDSLVRNNTAPSIVWSLRGIAHAKSVSMLIGSPPIRFPNFYGINLPEQKDLVAAVKSIEEIRKDIGCKRLGYLSLDGMLDTFFEVTGESADNFDLSCFTGDYPIPIGNRDIRLPAYAGYTA